MAAQGPAPGRRTLARLLTAPYGSTGLDVAAVDRSWESEGEMPSGTVAAALDANSAELGFASLASGAAYVPAAGDPEVLVPTRLMPGRSATCLPEGTVLGRTTERLLLGHLREGRPEAVARLGRPAGPLGLARRARSPRPPLREAPSTIPDIARRERRPVHGRKAGDPAPRTR